MKIIHISVKLKGKEKNDCGFCGNLFKGIDATHLLRTSDLDINKTVDINYVCDSCKEKIDNKIMSECSDCGRLKKSPTKKCLCVYMKENNLSIETYSGNDDDYNPLELEKQISILSEEKKQLTEEVSVHLEALETAEDWHKNQKQELLDRIKRLEEENRQLKEKNIQTQQVAQIEVKSSKRPFLLFGRK
jgi:hypothetical protein